VVVFFIAFMLFITDFFIGRAMVTESRGER